MPTTGAEVVDLGGARTVYPLTAEQIKALAGVNNVWSNAGNVTVEYPADTKGYIDAKTAALSEQIETLEAAQPKTVTVTGTVVTITAEDKTRYVCGELSTLTLTPPASGICDVVFTSGTTATVLTVPSTVRWPAWFDPTALEASTTYEINVQDGLGVVATWQA